MATDPTNNTKIEITKEDKLHIMCEESMSKVLSQSSLLNHLIGEMGRLGCNVDKVDFFNCKSCPLPVEGFYDRNLGVVICENNIVPTKTNMQQLLLHETFHAYDYCNVNLNFNDCEHIACTEIRATSLSGQCDFSQELKRGNTQFFAHRQKCIKRRAQLSLNSIPHCQEVSRSSVERAFRQCFKDTSPFPSTPHDVRV